MPTRLGVYLDVDELDWDAVEEHVLDAYCLIAPKRLVAQVRPVDP